MNMNEYQERAMSTCMASSNNISYMLIGMQGEMGELASKFAKAIRKGVIAINDNDMSISPDADPEVVRQLMDGVKGEIGDVLWFVACMCQVLGLSLEEVAQHNVDKLASRKQRGVIEGNGDER